MRIPSIAVVAALLACTVVTGAQSVQNGTIRVNTRLVEISVAVQDKSGPVADLRKEDFTVLDNGKPQRIDLFVVSDARTEKQSSIGPRPPGVVSNLRNAAGEIPKSATVILLDLMNSSNDGANRDATSPGVVALPRNPRSSVVDTVGAMGGGTNNLVSLRDQQDAIKQLVRYLRTMRAEDRVALFVLGYQLKVIQDFTGDSDVLLRAAARLKEMDIAGIEVSTQAQLAVLLEPPPISNPDGSVTYIGTPGFADSIVTISAINRATATADAFEAIARHMSGLPGRKNLVWMSAGFPFKPIVSERIVGLQAQSPANNPEEFSSQLNRASKALNDANIAVYPVDYQGLNGSYPEVMMRLAAATGGNVAYRTNDLQGAVSAAVADGDVSYTLGFYPADERYDGKLHDLKVRVNRKDVELRHRSGYYAAPKALSEKERRTIVAELLDSDVNSSQIGIVALGEPDPEMPGTYKITVSIDAANLDLKQEGDRRTGQLRLSKRLESSKAKSAQIGAIPLNFTETQFQNVLKRGFIIRQTVEAGPSDRLRIVLQDQSTGKTGAVWLPLQKR
jgi:VWFA-related protein